MTLRAAPFLNVDAGEMPGEPEELYALAHVVNVACGGHAGDEKSMRRVVVICKQVGTAVGAHPSYPDREGFGRRPMDLTPQALEAAVAEQCHALASVARREKVAVPYVKLHGALYHAAGRDPAVARAALRAITEALGWEGTVIGPPSGALREACTELGLAYAREGFADRGVLPDGSLVPRGQPGAMIEDPAAAAARAVAIATDVDTVCVHGDTAGALAVVRAVRAALDGLARGPA